MTKKYDHIFTRVYITGYGRSGSSALDKLISENFNLIGLGEVKHLGKIKYRGNHCACGQDLHLCDFWRNSPTYWSLDFIEYVSSRGYAGVVDSSKSTIDSRKHLRKAIVCPHSRFIEIRRPYHQIIRSVWRQTNNGFYADNIILKISRVLRSSINILWTRLIYYFQIRHQKSLLIRQYELLNDPKKVIDQVSSFINMPVEKNVSGCHQVAGNRLFHVRS